MRIKMGYCESVDLISIIVPVYNAEKYIISTIDCVRRQSFTNWELLLVEDCGTDSSRTLINDYIRQIGDDRIHLICQPSNMGAAKARNRGLAEAKGRYIAYIDADDIWEWNKLEREMAFMKEKKAGFVFTGYEFADESGAGLGKIVRVPERLTYRQALKNTTIFTSTVMFDTDKIDKEQLNMPEIKSEDTALWWKLLRMGYVAWGLNENLVKYRRSENTLSSNKLEAVRRVWNLYRKSENMGIIRSIWYFFFWGFNAVRRRV
jgi:teichuronic acid biosynthesis glycosyltransferase TuaG